MYAFATYSCVLYCVFGLIGWLVERVSKLLFSIFAFEHFLGPFFTFGLVLQNSYISIQNKMNLMVDGTYCLRELVNTFLVIFLPFGHFLGFFSYFRSSFAKLVFGGICWKMDRSDWLIGWESGQTLSKQRLRHLSKASPPFQKLPTLC